MGLRSHERAVRRSTRACSLTSSSRSATSRWTRDRGETRRSRSSPHCRRSSIPRGRRPRATPPASTTGPGARRHERWVREGARARGARDDRLPWLRRRRVRVSRANARRGREPGARAAPGRRSGTSSASRSTRRSARSPSTRVELLDADPETVNVNGGAVALGHPIGASGARILSTMVHELRRSGGGLGLAAICSGGGQGDALLIEV